MVMDITKERATKHAEAFTDGVNFGVNAKEFAAAMMRQHRTLQQGSFRLMVACIEQWAKAYDDGWYDDRDAATVKASKEIWESYLKNTAVPFI